MTDITMAPTEPASCCAPAAQERCCAPSSKDECCGTEATAGGGCGCAAGQAPADASLQEAVRAKYAAAAGAVLEQEASACCSGAGVISDAQRAAFGQGLYGDDHAGLPGAAVLASLGCGNPIAVAALASGETVLDLGSGGGIDVLLSARRVGPAGKAYGLDMTDEMIELARRNQAEAGVTNVEFLKGTIERVPLPDASVDVIISNCVINLSGDKPQVLREAARVLRPGGRLAVSDVIADEGMDAATRADMQLWTGCVAGALTAAEFRRHLVAAGFTDIEVQETHRVHDQAYSAVVRARKPADETGQASA